MADRRYRSYTCRPRRPKLRRGIGLASPRQAGRGDPGGISTLVIMLDKMFEAGCGRFGRFVPSAARMTDARPRRCPRSPPKAKNVSTSVGAWNFIARHNAGPADLPLSRMVALAGQRDTAAFRASESAYRPLAGIARCAGKVVRTFRQLK